MPASPDLGCDVGPLDGVSGSGCSVILSHGASIRPAQIGTVATDLFGIPIGRVIDGANRNASILLEPTLQAVAGRGLLQDVQTLHLDRGYDSNLTIERRQGLGITDIACAKKKLKCETNTKKPLTLGLRWPVKRTKSWLSNFGQLRRNTDRFSHQRRRQIGLLHRPHPDRETSQIG